MCSFPHFPLHTPHRGCTPLVTRCTPTRPHYPSVTSPHPLPRSYFSLSLPSPSLTPSLTHPCLVMGPCPPLPTPPTRQPHDVCAIAHIVPPFSSLSPSPYPSPSCSPPGDSPHPPWSCECTSTRMHADCHVCVCVRAHSLTTSPPCPCTRTNRHPIRHTCEHVCARRPCLYPPTLLSYPTCAQHSQSTHRCRYRCGYRGSQNCDLHLHPRRYGYQYLRGLPIPMLFPSHRLMGCQIATHTHPDL